MGRFTCTVGPKGRVAIPRQVRKKLGLKPGDTLVYREIGLDVVVEKHRPELFAFGAFTEWASPEDEIAFAHLQSRR